jgi:hypothetical protein
MKETPKTHPAWICWECGLTIKPISSRDGGSVTMNIGKCDICGKENVGVVHARNYGYPVLKKNKNK